MLQLKIEAVHMGWLHLLHRINVFVLISEQIALLSEQTW